VTLTLMAEVVVVNVMVLLHPHLSLSDLAVVEMEGVKLLGISRIFIMSKLRYTRISQISHIMMVKMFKDGRRNEERNTIHTGPNGSSSHNSLTKAATI